VDETTKFILSGIAGYPVDVVLYDDGETHLIKTQVVVSAPLQLKVVGQNRFGLRAGRRVMLLAHYEGLALKADAHLDRFRNDEEGLFLDIGSVNWEILERRRHIRVPVEIPVLLRAVYPGEGEPEVRVVEGTSLDMSISGAYVKTDELLEEGALLEFSVEIEGQTVRTLAVIAHVATEHGGLGLHFVEYLENARQILHGFLTRAA